MDPYYSSPSSHYYYHHASCPSYDTSPSFASDPYVDPYSSYPAPSTSYYYPSYTDAASSSPIVFYNNSTTNIYAPSSYTTPQSNTQMTPPSAPVVQSTPSLNTTFESGMILSLHRHLTLSLLLSSSTRPSSSSTNNFFQRPS